MPASLKPPLSRTTSTTASGTETPVSTSSDACSALSDAPTQDERPEAEAEAGGESSSAEDPPIRHPRLAALAREKYLLQVTAGPAYDPATHVPVPVNAGDDAAPTLIENDLVRAAVRVRIRNYRGLPAASPRSSGYFAHATRAREQYSIAFSFVPKVDIRGDEAIWGNDFDHPIRDRLPPGFGVAVRIVKNLVDPSIELDAYADRPWMYAPALCSFFAMRVGGRAADADDDAAPADVPPVDADAEPLVDGADGEEPERWRAEVGFPEQAGRRRRWARSRKNREAFVFERGRLYQADFFNPYIDFANFSLKLPGFSINCIRYINDKTHRLRYVFKNSATGELYLCVVLTLLHGADLLEAVRAEDKRLALENDANGDT